MRAVAFAVLLLAVAAPAATAHAEYQSSEPPQGAQLRLAPVEVVVRFTERVESDGTMVEVQDAAGARVDDGDVHVTASPPMARVGLRPLGEGAYLVKWRTLSGADGHPTTGSFGFAVGNATAPGSTTGELQTSPWSMAARIVAVAAWAIAFGSVAFAMWMGTQGIPTRAVVVAGVVSGLAVVAVLAWSLQAAGVPVSAAWQTRTGQLLGGRAILTAVAVALLRWRWLSMALLALAAFLGVLVSHPSNAGALAVGAAFLHVLAVGVWLGGLAGLMAAARRTDAQRLGLRFGKLALPLVIVLAFTGALEAYLLTRASWPLGAFEWSASTYGQLILGKVAVFAVMLGLAALARFALLRRADRARHLQKSVAIEAAFGALVLCLAGVLASTSPPYGLPEAQTIHAEGDAYVYEVTVTPAPEAGGHSMVSVAVFGSDGRPITNETCGRPTPCLTLRVTAPGADGPQTIQAPLHDGTRMGHVLWTQAGSWRIDLEFSTQDVFRDRAHVVVEVPS